jgi:hypothetical protein
VIHLLGSKRVVDKLALILDDGQGLLRHQPQVASLAADAALAVADRLDLGGLDLEDEGAAVAVAAVRLGGLLGVRHVATGGTNCKTKIGQWSMAIGYLKLFKSVISMHGWDVQSPTF